MCHPSRRASPRFVEAGACTIFSTIPSDSRRIRRIRSRSCLEKCVDHGLNLWWRPQIVTDVIIRVLGIDTDEDNAKRVVDRCSRQNNAQWARLRWHPASLLAIVVAVAGEAAVGRQALPVPSCAAGGACCWKPLGRVVSLQMWFTQDIAQWGRRAWLSRGAR